MRLIPIFIFLLSSLFADEIAWAKSYEKAIEKAKNSNKIAMVMLSQEGCDACWYMNNIVFADERVQDEINRDFIAVIIDKDFDEIPEGMTLKGTPTFYFMRGNKSRVGRQFRGALNVSDFLEVLYQKRRENGEGL